MAAPRAESAPPGVFSVAGHPLRWRLLRELAWSDRRVRELVESVGEPQPLVSYHLRRLRSAELVSVRRSSFDGRDAYYSLRLERAGELLADAGEALHPALRLSAPVMPELRRGSRPVRVLFLCTGNSSRSQIAEALLGVASGGAVEAASAGSRPKPLHPNTARVLAARGIDVSGRRPKHFDELAQRGFDYVVSLCDRVREVCPEFPADPRVSHWSVPDPSAEAEATGDADGPFERAAADLETRIRFLLHRIAHDTATTEVTVP
jgi:ArsR family transcriptional regulator, arsenate/arsenite/antimonite-responsive transcriptional repressor / arsenate reductase (thioredoxin)